MQNLAGHLWTVGQLVTTEVAVQSVSMVHSIQTWRKNRNASEELSPDEEIHNILNMYSAEELGHKAERYLMNLRTDILDIAAEHDNDIRVQLYIFRNSHSFGSGKNCIVINITDSNINMKIKLNQPATPKKRTEQGESLSVVRWANNTKDAVKRLSPVKLNF
ncbi:uncharacterized protein [Mytilus edulis]|uniref:uncharacterized protein n=1 Tax=Mytilus edulis TaxID=6550 RepID=UPI0039EE61FB